MEKSKKFLTAAVALFAACLIALGAMLCIPDVARAEGTSDLTLVNNADGAATLDYTVGSTDTWIKMSAAQNAGTANMSAYGGLVYDVETDSQSFASGENTIYPTMAVAIRENNDAGKEYRLNGKKAFGIYVYADGETKTNSSLGIGANNFPSEFRGTIAVPWGAFTKGTEALTAEKLSNASVFFIIEHATFTAGAKIKISNVRAVKDTTETATHVSVNNTFGYIAGVTLDEANATTLKERFVDAKDKYNGMTDENKAKIVNADKIATIEAKFAAYEVEKKIAACPTSVTAENYEAAKTALAEAKAAYNALSVAEKELVTNANRIAEAENAIATYEASSLSDRIAALPDTITDENVASAKAALAALRAEYDALDQAAKDRITNAGKLDETKTKIETFEANKIITRIAALPDEITDENVASAKAALAALRAEYDALDQAAKDRITNAGKLDETATAIENYEVNKVNALIVALPESIDKTNYASAKAAVASAKAAYAALDASAQAKITNADKIDATETAIKAYEVENIEDFTLVNSATGESVMDYTIPVASGGWLRISLEKGQKTMDLSAAGGLAFDIETNSTGKAGFTLFFDEDGDGAKRYGGYGNKTFGLFVFEDGVCKTNSALGHGANNIPAGFKGTIFMSWESFEKGKEYASAEKATNVGILIYVDNTMFGAGTKLKISNFRAVKNPTLSATIASVNNTFAYLAATDVTAENYASYKSRFTSSKAKYAELSDENKAKVTDADKIDAIDAKLETYEIGVVIGKIDACLTEVNADSYENAKFLYTDAKKAYNALSDESKERVTNAENIALATAAIETYEAGLFDAKIDALPGSVSSDNVTDAKVELEKIRAEYDGLDDGVKAKVGGADKIAALSEKIDVHEAGEVQSLIAALTDKIDKDNYKKAKKQYLAAQKAYGALTANGKTKVTNASKFEAVKAAIEKYENTDPVNVAAIITIAVGAAVVVAGAVLIIVKAKKSRG